jgi:chromate transporter
VTEHPRQSETTRTFAEIGLLSFGGPAAQIALMHRVLVEEKRWLSEQQFLNALSFCMLLPGPEAMQLATFAGWRLHGIRGGLIAGALFVLPGALVMLVLAALYAQFGAVPLAQTLFLGIKAAVLVIVIEALLKVSKRALTTPSHWVIAALAFIAIFFFALPFPLIVLAAGIWGALKSHRPALEITAPIKIEVSPLITLRVLLIGMVVWLAPLLLLPTPFLTQLGAFFAKLAVVTFGGAYAVLAYMAQDVVTQMGWLTAQEMMDGLALAETTPGPLILVTEFVGFLAAHHAGGMSLALAATAVTLWATFIPCFVWIFLGAPYLDWISAQPRLNAALRAITAAVVGVILNLSIWFALHAAFGNLTRETLGPLVLWSPDIDTLDWRIIVVAVLSALLMFRLKFSIIKTLPVASASGWLLASMV